MGNQTNIQTQDDQVVFLTSRLEVMGKKVEELQQIIKKLNDRMIVQEATTEGLKESDSEQLDTNRQFQMGIAGNARKMAMLREQMEVETS